MFCEVSVRDALAAENWDPELAQDRLFRGSTPKTVSQKPSLNASKLLDLCRAKNTERKASEAKNGCKGQTSFEGLPCYQCNQRGVSSSASTVASDSESDRPSKDVQIIRDVFEEARRKGNELQQKQAHAAQVMAPSLPEQGKRRPDHAQPKRKIRGLVNKTKH